MSYARGRAPITAFQINLAFAQAPASSNGEPNQTVVNDISHCLADGLEAVLRPQKVECARYQQGAASIGDLPQDFKAICSDAEDRRRLPGNIIKTVVRQHGSAIGASGIRLIGGVYCDTLDLIGS